jgi:hypothetical protein
MRTGLFVCLGLGCRVGVVFAATLAFAVTSSDAAPLCEPLLAFRDARLSEPHPETMQRRWTALLDVDASRCATATGRFEIIFTRQKEHGPEIDFVESFVWTHGLIEVSVEFWADEAVEGYRLTGFAECPCRD